MTVDTNKIKPRCDRAYYEILNSIQKTCTHVSPTKIVIPNEQTTRGA